MTHYYGHLSREQREVADVRAATVAFTIAASASDALVVPLASRVRDDVADCETFDMACCGVVVALPVASEIH